MGMKTTSLLCFVFVVSMVLRSCEGYKFNVGGRDGWVTHPSEDYNHWAQRMRFQVNDTLLFKYKKGNDSVLVVTKENYNTCNTKDPIKTLSQGDSAEYMFQRSGPHYFISGNADHCINGEKLIVVVLAVRPKKSPPTPMPITPAPAPAPAVSPAPEPSAPASKTPAPASVTADSPAPSTQEKAAAPKVGYSVGALVVVSVVSVMILGV